MLGRISYPIQDAFKELGVSPPTGYKLIDAGTLKTYKIGKRRYASASALEACIRELEQLEQEKGAA